MLYLYFTFCSCCRIQEIKRKELERLSEQNKRKACGENGLRAKVKKTQEKIKAKK